MEVSVIDKTYAQPLLKAAMVMALLIGSGILSQYRSPDDFLNAVNSLIIFVIVSVIMLIWGINLYHRFIDGNVRIVLFTIESLYFVMLIIRILQIQYFRDDLVASQHLLSGIYVLLIIIPLLSFVVVFTLSQGQTDINIFNILLIVPVVSFLLVILIPEVQSRFFTFLKYLGYPADQTQMFADMVNAWIFLLSLSMLWLLAHRPLIPEARRRLRIPVIMSVVLWLFMFARSAQLRDLSITVLDQSLIYSIYNIAMMEILLQLGIIPANYDYIGFFHKSGIEAYLVSLDGKIIEQSEVARPIDSEQVAELLKQGVVWTNDEGVFYTLSIKGGYIVWHEDLSKQNRLIRTVLDQQDELNLELDLVQSEVSASQRSARARHQLQMYQDVLDQLRPDLDRMDSLFTQALTQQDAYDTVIRATQTGFYIKKMAQLLLRIKMEQTASSEELILYLKNGIRLLERSQISVTLHVTDEPFEVPLERMILSIRVIHLLLTRCGRLHDVHLFIGRSCLVQFSPLPNKSLAQILEYPSVDSLNAQISYGRSYATLRWILSLEEQS